MIKCDCNNAKVGLYTSDQCKNCWLKLNRQIIKSPTRKPCNCSKGQYNNPRNK